MSLVALILSWIITGTTIANYGILPLDHDLVEQQPIEQPFLEWKATWYDYKLKGKRWSKTHNTCAMRVWERYKMYKVCSKLTGKCVECKLNDYWPKEETGKVIDLSSHAFKELWIPLSRGVAEVQIYQVTN